MMDPVSISLYKQMLRFRVPTAWSWRQTTDHPIHVNYTYRYVYDSSYMNIIYMYMNDRRGLYYLSKIMTEKKGA